MYTTTAWAKTEPASTFEKIQIKRNNPSDTDVTFKLMYCGICHTDVHIAGNEMGKYLNIRETQSTPNQRSDEK